MQICEFANFSQKSSTHLQKATLSTNPLIEFLYGFCYNIDAEVYLLFINFKQVNFNYMALGISPTAPDYEVSFRNTFGRAPIPFLTSLLQWQKQLRRQRVLLKR